MEIGNTKKKVISGLFWSYGERILAQLITLIVSIVLARILSPDDYGIVSIVMVLITICNALVTGGFGNALIQKKDATELDFNSICWVSTLFAIVLYIILFMLAPLIANFYNSRLLISVIRVMGIRFVFSAFNSIQQAYVQRKMIFKKFFFATLGGTIFSAILGISMAYKGFGVWALVMQYLSNTIIDTIILYVTIEWKPKAMISWRSVKELWGFGSKMLASTMVYTLKDNIRSLVIGKKFTKSDLAYYNQGQKFPSLLVQDVAESIGKVLFPVLSNKQDNRNDIKNYMRRSIKVSSYVLTPIIIGLYSVADTFVSAILTDKWLPCVPYLRILCIVYITRSMTAIFQQSLLSIGKSGVSLLHEIVTSLLTIILILLAAIVFNSIDLIAWSYVIVMLVGLFIYWFYVNKEFKYKFFELIIDYCPTLIMSIIMGCCVYGIGLININILLKLILQIIVGSMIYILISIILKLESYEYLKNTILGIIKSKRYKKEKRI